MEQFSKKEAVDRIVETLQRLEPTINPYEVLKSAELCFGILDAPPDGGF